jgi:hypothetical protein
MLPLRGGLPTIFQLLSAAEDGREGVWIGFELGEEPAEPSLIWVLEEASGDVFCCLEGAVSKCEPRKTEKGGIIVSAYQILRWLRQFVNLRG